MSITPIINYRLSIPIIDKHCKYCNKVFQTKFSTFCSGKCKAANHRLKKRNETIKDLVCYYCGGSVTKRDYMKFCCKEHRIKFNKAKEYNKPITLVINSRTTIMTRKYNSIPKVIKAYRKTMTCTI